MVLDGLEYNLWYCRKMLEPCADNKYHLEFFSIAKYLFISINSNNNVVINIFITIMRLFSWMI